MPFDQFNPNLIRSFDESEFKFAPGQFTDLAGHFNAVLTHPLQPIREIVDTEADMVDDPSSGRFQLCLSLPMIGIDLLRIFDRINDDVDVIAHERNARSDLDLAINSRFTRWRPI